MMRAVCAIIKIGGVLKSSELFLCDAPHALVMQHPTSVCPLESNSFHATQELCVSCSSLLGPLRCIKCVIVEIPSSSSRGETVWTSDALVFLKAISIHNPAAIVIRDTVSATRKRVGSGSRSAVSWTCRLVDAAQRWVLLGASRRFLSLQMYRATSVCVDAFKLISVVPEDLFASEDPQYLSLLAEALQHADPTLESRNTASNGVASNLCSSTRVAVDAMKLLLSRTPKDCRINFNMVTVNTIGGVSSAWSCADLGVCMDVRVSDVQRYATVYRTSSAVDVAGVVLIDGDCICEENKNSYAKFGVSSTTVLHNAAELLQEYRNGGAALQALNKLVDIFCKCFHGKPGLVLVCGSAAPHVVCRCSSYGILVVPHVRYGDLEAISRTNAAQLVGDPWTCCPDDIGHPVTLATKLRGWMAPEDAPSVDNDMSYSGADANASMRHGSVHLVVVPRKVSSSSAGELAVDGSSGSDQQHCTKQQAQPPHHHGGGGGGGGGGGVGVGVGVGGSSSCSSSGVHAMKVPIHVTLCSRVPSLLDDEGVRFWKMMHRLRHALDRCGNAASADNGEDRTRTPEDMEQNTTLLPGGGVAEAVAIVALRRAAASAARSFVDSSRIPSNGVTESDVFLSYANMLEEHLLALVMNSGLMLEESFGTVGEYLLQVDALVGPIFHLDAALRRSAWHALRQLMMSLF